MITIKNALVLAGGGAKGAYQAGSIKALYELGFQFDIVTGTSIGALNGLLVVQQEPETLYNLWSNLTLQDVITHPISFDDFSMDSILSQKNLITSFFKSYIKHKGADNAPLISLINQHFNSYRFRSSPIDYGLVTILYPSLIPQEITKKDMNPDEAVEYAIASASCFPAFPVYYIEKQGYIDGGYYDNLPITAAINLGADAIITIELQNGPVHEYFLDRPSIIRIRPYNNLGTFFDFSRDALDQRMTLGYLDTYKVFQKYKGYKYTFTLSEINYPQQNYLYQKILALEDSMNHVSPKIILDNMQPLTAYLLSLTHKKVLTLEDYTIVSLETTLDIYKYPVATIYSYDSVVQSLQQKFLDEYNSYAFTNNVRAISLKKIATLLKNISVKEAVYHIYQLLESKQDIDSPFLASHFPRPYIIALYLYTIIHQ